jgi:exopolyphosphatase/guanosine-5'-triphosphate,3'-diphosphate pyrophosphatase
LTEWLGRRGRQDELGALRAHAREIAAAGLPQDVAEPPHAALGSSGTIRAVVGFAAPAGTARVTRRQLAAAVASIAAMSPGERRARFGPSRADVIAAGAVALEAIVERAGIAAMTAVCAGLRDGVLVQMARERATGELAARAAG